MKKRDLIMLIGGLLLIGILLMAPDETTKHVPHNEIHALVFQTYASDGKKTAEKTCVQCHNDDGGIPFSETHPTKSRCLFCHKIE